MRRIFLALALVLLAVASAGVLAYGTDPVWARYSRGLQLILFARRFQWLMAGLSLVACLALLGLVIGGKQRAWTLLGLLPVVLLFDHRFAGDPIRKLGVVEDPPMLWASDPAAPADADLVVGVVFNGTPFAFPYSALGASPVVLQDAHDKRFVLMWSAYANRATAAVVSRDMKPRDLEVVSMPANALLVYNGRLGQFINGLTGMGMNGQRPTGFFAPLEVQKGAWRDWKASHPGTRVMAVPAGAVAIREPLTPRYPEPGRAGDGAFGVAGGAEVLAGPSLMAASGPSSGPASATDAGSSRPTSVASNEPAAGRSVVFISVGRPIACAVDALAGGPVQVDLPAGGNAPEVHLLIFRDKGTGRLRVFDRQVSDPDTQEAMFPTFRRRADPKKPHVAFADKDSNSAWSADLKAVDGAWKNQQLRQVRDVDECVPWGVMKSWYPRLAFVTPKAVEEPPLLRPTESARPKSTRRPRRL